MTQPTQYLPVTSFAQDEAQGVSGRAPVRTANLDAELAAIQLSINQLIANLGVIQRDDTALRDGAVKPYTLSTDVLALIGSAGFTVPANGSMTWITAGAYVPRNFVMQGASSYVCITAHTAGTFATDLAAGKWVIVGGAGSLTASGLPFTPTGTLAATNVQSAIAEASLEALQKSANLSDLASPATALASLGAVAKTGDTLSGALTLAGNPSSALHAVPRQYVTGRQTVWVPAGAMRPRSSNPCGSLVSAAVGAGQADLTYLSFDPSSTQYAQFSIAMPKGWNEGTVSAQFVWSGGGSGNCVWGLQAAAYGDGDAMAVSFGTAQEVVDSYIGVNVMSISAETGAITIGNTPAELDTVVFQVYRNAPHASDTMSTANALLGVRLYFTTDAPTDA